MRNLILLLSILFTYTVSAQSTTIPNPDFENWNGGKPNSWDISNETILGVQFTTGTQDNNPHSGSKALQLETIEKTVPLAGAVALPGLATLGDFVLNVAQQSAVVTGSIQFNSRPSSFKGYYKALPLGGDKSFIIAYFIKLNPLTQSVDTLGKAKLLESNTINTWTQFNIPVAWTSSDNPDNMNIILSSSNVTSGTNGNIGYIKGSKLWVDNLSLEYIITGAEEIVMNGGAKVFPNPVRDKLNITFGTKKQNRSFVLVDMTGKILFETTTHNNITIEMSEYPQGIYILNIYDPSLTIQNSVKIIK